eukprot:TRINITY_DN10975_c0_g2_i1.p2 TRINITY_DN10975_c0_g2~~TRINITY_DN10975_c0_g2_i1.p2  ORF type:complete len:127 (+),score=11.74 TRINITY_DN10975_c0_g2_i1:64-444(+)
MCIRDRYECLECALEKFTVTYNQNCLSGGRYCAQDPDNDGPMTGRDVLLEVLNQLCVKQVQPLFWKSYVSYFGANCLDAKDYKGCSFLDILYILKDSKKGVEECVEQSFEGKAYELNDNKLSLIHI